MDCNLPGSSVHGILQARILSGLPFPSLGDLPYPGIEPSFMSPALAGRFFVASTTWNAHTYFIVTHKFFLTCSIIHSMEFFVFDLYLVRF